MALRTVPWLTRKRAASSNSLGIMSPGFHSPACRLRRISDLICWYSGLKAGVGGVNAGSAAPLVSAGTRVSGGGQVGLRGVCGGHGMLVQRERNHILYKT